MFGFGRKAKTAQTEDVLGPELRAELLESFHAGMERVERETQDAYIEHAIFVARVRKDYETQRACFLAGGGDPMRVPELPAEGLPFRTVGNFLYMSSGYDNW